MLDVTPLLDHARRQIQALRRLPESTYRLQFHKDFTFRHAAVITPYLAHLGVTHCYASPYLKAKPGSTHGYDVIDHCALNPELGTQADFEHWLAVMNEHGMSHILDTVPNHVGVATNENNWWNDVLRHGPRSAYANYFDIAWRGSPRPELHDKLLLPVLGQPYGQALERDELKLTRDGDEFYVNYYDRRFPIAPETYSLIPANPGSITIDQLDDLLARQHYRLAWWRTASDEINYRRFFDINDLAALAQEHLEVFEATHAFTLRLLATGALSGLRIDHPDGLYDPEQYFHRLQQHFVLAVAREMIDSDEEWQQVKPALAEGLSRLSPSPGTPGEGRGEGSRPARSLLDPDPPLYVTIEKILAPDEPLPQSWPVHGTSGYDFLNKVNGLFVDASSEPAFTKLYQDLIADRTSFPDLIYQKKLLVLDIALASELQMLAHAFDRVAQRHRSSRDFTLNGLRLALRQVIACFGVYRSYITERGVSETDVKHVEAAVDDAIQRNPKAEPLIFHFIRDTILQRLPAGVDDDYRAAALRLAGKFQQLTAPVTAKGIEDTAFYIFNRFASLNEVGGEPDHFRTPADELHRYLADRQAHWPYALSALSTHDTKRSEDVRARLNVLSEMPDEWAAHVRRWRDVNARFIRTVNDLPAPGPNEEYLLYQTLVGAYPFSRDPKGSALQDFTTRIQAYMQKALREAKLFTSWTNPNAPYESAINDFVASILNHSPFLESLHQLLPRVAHFGLLNSLSQTLLRLCAPGVPDTYQGTELWDFSLVDPDNRRPVDYELRRNLIEAIERTPPGELLRSKEDGRVKMFLTTTALRARRDNPGLFSTGEYIPLRASGARAEHVFAFARRRDDGQAAVVIVPRLISRITDDLPLGDDVWRDTRIALPLRSPVTDLFTGQTYEPAADLRLADVLAEFSVALLIGRADM